MKAQPRNDEAMIAANDHGLWQTKTDDFDSARACGLDQGAGAAASKRIATLAARAALAGAQLVRLDVDAGEPPMVLTNGAHTLRFGLDEFAELERAVEVLEGQA